MIKSWRGAMSVHGSVSVTMKSQCDLLAWLLPTSRVFSRFDWKWDVRRRLADVSACPYGDNMVQHLSACRRSRTRKSAVKHLEGKRHESKWKQNVLSTFFMVTPKPNCTSAFYLCWTQRPNLSAIGFILEPWNFQINWTEKKNQTITWI